MTGSQSIAALQSLEVRLVAAIERVSIRGRDIGAFLFAEHAGRAIEVSTNDGKWWIEMWDRDEDEYAQPVREVTVQSDDEAVQEILSWLCQD